ncbi:small ribosomal subunit Rsm22 family protein [Halobacteriovorax sp. HLS]|uniref:small ribosomal subunit Rsm22 family protein n=1 Tax=Halobacteriovorax sp. HLS TaxID=2234000 RepID=UPI000FD78198|nr:small ribosomal subunit Rsm22 family protein [Halobacteriovorax sp. HLS]
MKFELEQIKKNLLCEDMTEHRLVQTLELISKGFTSKRENISKYVNDREYVSAYTSFYLPTNIPKLKFVFDQLPKDLLSSIKDSHIVDYGCGPGTFSFAFDEYFDGDIRVTGVDQSSIMIEQAKKLNERLYLNTDLHFDSEIPAQWSEGTLLFGHSMNEMGHERALKLITQHRPKHIIFIEPGTSEVFKSILAIRDALSKSGYTCFYPCQNIQMRCPVGERVSEGLSDWCHQVIRTTHGPDIERLAQLIKLDRKTMPLIAHVYSTEVTRSSSLARMIRFYRETKFSFDWEVCLEREGKLSVIDFEVTKRELTKGQIKYLQKISVGLEFEFEVIKELGPDRWRVKINLD